MSGPRNFKDYDLLEQIGSGGMATVFLARDLRDDSRWAIKVLQPELHHSDAAKERLRSEAQALQRLRHPGVVALREVIEDEGRIGLVMQYLPGGSLWQRIGARGPMAPSVAAETMIQLLHALEYAHRQGVVHRDLTPHNVLLTEDGRPLLTDFGIARLYGDGPRLTQTGDVLGTWSYMSPEQRVDASRADARSDVFSAAATLYAMVTGRHPDNLVAAEVLDGLHLAVGPALSVVIRQGARFHPQERTASASALREALEAVLPTLSGLPAQAPPPRTAFGLTDSPAHRRTSAPGTRSSPRPWAWLLLSVVPLSALALALATRPDQEPNAASPAQSPKTMFSAEDLEAEQLPPPLDPDWVVMRRVERVLDAPARVQPKPPAASAQPEEPPLPNEAPELGVVLVISRPAAVLSVDGTVVGRTRWRGKLSLGEHKLLLTTDTGESVVGAITVTERGTERFCWDFGEDKACR